MTIKQILAIFFVAALLGSCQSEDKPVDSSANALTNPNNGLENNSNTSKFKQQLKDNILWQTLFNRQIDFISRVYEDSAFLFDATGKVYQTQEQILEFLKAVKTEGGTIDSINTLANIVADKENLFEYEIGSFSTSNKQGYKYLQIWSGKSGTKKKRLEWIAKSTSTPPVTAELVPYREKWVERCNAHSAIDLVKNLYTKNAIYYNHKPLITGTQAIAKAYDYMNRPDYKLQLTPTVVETVTDQLAFEIGQCSGSYEGKYILVWVKETDGNWRILFDSNI